MMPMPRYVSCPSHGYRLCPVYDQDYWQRYAELTGAAIRQQWAERRLIARWLDLVRQTHRDEYTMTYLERCLRLGNWTRRDLHTAEQIEVGR
jgi:hypothetical protein